jgi:hypothetical protein
MPSNQWGVIETSSKTPTVGGLAYTQVYTWLAGATLAQPCSSGSNGVWTCSLTRPGGYTVLAIWNPAGATTYNPAPGFTDYRGWLPAISV